MEIERGAWGRFVVRAVVLGAVVFGAVRLAVARDGVAGGAARSYVTVAGTLTGATGSPRLTFRFRRTEGDGGVSPALCEPSVVTLVREGGTFSVEVPLEDATSRCPDDLFDGRDVVVEVLVNGAPIVGRFAVNPVPYAIRADVAATARRAESATGALAGLVGAGVRRIDCSWTAETANSENSFIVPAPGDGAEAGRSLLLIETNNDSTNCGPTGSFSHSARMYVVASIRGYPSTVYRTHVVELAGTAFSLNNSCMSEVRIEATGAIQLNNRIRANVYNATGHRVSCTIIPLR